MSVGNVRSIVAAKGVRLVVDNTPAARFVFTLMGYPREAKTAVVEAIKSATGFTVEAHDFEDLPCQIGRYLPAAISEGLAKSLRALRANVQMVPYKDPIAPPFDYNPDAQAALSEVRTAFDKVDEELALIGTCVGAAGSAEKLREAVPILMKAAAILRVVARSREEDRRREEYDVPGRDFQY